MTDAMSLVFHVYLGLALLGLFISIIQLIQHVTKHRRTP